MRIILIAAVVMSFSAFAQTRVRENIKQQSLSTSTSSSSTEEVSVSKEKPQPKSATRKKR